MSIESVLSADGLIASRLPSYESRPQQISMAQSIEQVLDNKQHLMVEAGTGVGKSFAYLVPLIQHIHASRKKAIVSTHTINLQQQLIDKDIPLLQSIMPEEFTAVLAIGRGNYICLRRLKKALARGHAIFDSKDQQKQLQTIRDWADQTTDGTLSSMDVQPDAQVWSEVNAEPGNCLGKGCPHYRVCHWQAARRRVMNANLVIVNHSLLMADLALRAAGSQLLPKYEAVVIDEAHCLERTASEHLGFRVSEGQIDYFFRRLFNTKKGTGFLLPYMTDSISTALNRAGKTAKRHFDQLRRWYDESAPANKRIPYPDLVDNELSTALQGLYHAMAETADDIEDQGDRLEYNKYMDRALDLAEHLRILNAQTAAGFVYWLEEVGRRKRLQWTGAPIDVSQTLHVMLFDQVETAVLTSATMTLGRESSFRYIQNQLGLQEARTEVLGSPFNYQQQVQCYIPETMPSPDKGLAYESALKKHITSFVKKTQGRALVLFTSTQLMKKIFEDLQLTFEQQNLLALCQGHGQSRQQLLQDFREHGHAVLFGVDSFWQGIDVPGEALSNVIITRLPFPVPTHPLVEAKSEWITKRGGNAFMDYSVPEAALKLKQGFGRLIRGHQDEGIVVILDSRILHRRYGRRFIDSLPTCTIITNLQQEHESPVHEPDFDPPF